MGFATYLTILLVVTIGTDRLARSSTTTLKSCQGTSYQNSLDQCEDGGVQRLSSGGNVTILVKSATNLPNRDSTGPSAGVSDPYVRFIAGNVAKKSKYVRNDLNPVWNDYVSMGFLGSATRLDIEVWDKDSGLEFSDDLMLEGSIKVPYCSAMHANYSTVDCGQPFGCAADDSLWQMPKRLQCHYTGEVHFRPGVVLSIEIFIVPFVISAEVEYLPGSGSVMSVASGSKAAAAWTSAYGFPFYDHSDRINSGASFTLLGAALLKTSNTYRSHGDVGSVQFYAGLNFPSDVHVCHYAPNGAAPSWIARGFSASLLTVNKVFLGASVNAFNCYWRHEAGTVKNKDGGVMSGAVPFYSSRASDEQAVQKNYIVMAVPKAVAPREELVTILFDSLSFVSFMCAYGLVWAFLVWAIRRFLSKIDYRLDRLTAYLSSRVLSGGDNSSIVASLFVTYGQTPCNVDYRAHMFHARNALVLVLAAPFLLLISWGFSCVAVVRPAAVGYGVAFGGSALLFLWFGMALWERSHWRLSPLALSSLSLAVLSLLVFLLAVIFADPAVSKYNHALNFTALSLVFGTINCVPLLLLTFKQDRRQSSHLLEMLGKMGEALAIMRAQRTAKSKNSKAAAAPDAPTGLDLQVNKLLHGVLGEAYTVNPAVPALRFSAIMQEIPESAAAALQEEQQQRDGKTGDGALSHSERYRVEHNLYYLSLTALLVYIIIAAARTDFPSLAFLNCLALMLLDGLHLSISHGDISWSSGFKIALLLAGRVLIMGSPPSLWVLNYSAAYMLYGIILAQETINQFLPSVSRRRAAEVAFAGHEKEVAPTADIAGTSYFSLGLLTVAFAAVLLVCAYKDAREDLPIPTLTVLGQDQWPVVVFGLMALLLTVIASLLSATLRAFFLQRHGLLRGWARDNYLIRREVSVPITLAIFTELAVLSFGILVYASTKSAAVLVGCIFLPVIFLLLGHAYQTWVRNDYELVRWPPRSDLEGGSGPASDKQSDLETAFGMIENLFGSGGDEAEPDGTTDEEQQLLLADVEEDEGPQTDEVAPAQQPTLKGFKLPPLKVTGNKLDGAEIKMPPLPLKSVLRRKRQNLGIKTRLPIVNDLRAREDAADPDRFGDAEEAALDLDDPWAQFEREAREEEELKKKKKATTYAVAKRESIWKHPAIVAVRKAKVWSWLARAVQSCISCVRRGRAKVYPGLAYQPAGEGEEEESPCRDLEKGGTTAATAEDDSNAGHDEDRVLTQADIALLPYSQAQWGGYLARSEYSALAAWYGALLAILLFGVTLARTVSPPWLGHVIWVSLWMVLLTGVPLVKYFNTYTFDASMRSLAYLAALLHFLFCLCFFVAQLGADIGLVGSLWVLDFFFFYPIFLYAGFALYSWCDAGFQSGASAGKDWSGGDFSLLEFVRYYSALPLAALMIIFIWQLYIWISNLSGVVATLAFIASALAILVLRDWAANENYLSTVSAVLGGLALNLVLFVTGMVVLFSDSNPILPGSVFFFVLAFKQGMQVAARAVLLDQDLVLFCAPFLFPVYSYDAKTHDVADESGAAKDVLCLMLIGLAWGCFVAIFFYPINIGIALACCFLLGIAASGAIAVSHVPIKLAKSAAMLSPESILEAANVAREKFADRRLPLQFELAEWDGEEGAGGSAAEELNSSGTKKTTLDRQKERSSISLAVELAGDVRSLRYVREEPEEAPEVAAMDEEDVYDLPWHRQALADARAFLKQVFEMLPTSRAGGWRRHNQGAFTWSDAAVEVAITGRGPYGLPGCEGRIYQAVVKWKESPRMVHYYPAWLDSYDSAGNSLRTVQLSEPLDVVGLQRNITECDRALDWAFREEARCAVHFFLLLLVGAEAKMQREQVLFQKFLRENRFRLASNGITPPHNIFSSESFASINIPLVAVWLSTLAPEERERFHALKAAFSEEQRDRDELVDNSDYQTAFEAQQLLREREARDKEMADRLNFEILKRKEQRVQDFADSCEGFERAKFQNRRELWTQDPNCFVDLKEQDLYDRFRAACLGDHQEALECARQALVDIEAAQRDTRLGEYGRAYQYIDSEFAPSDASIGNGECANYVLGWRCAPGISDTVQLFDGGTHPDEVSEGVFKDAWLLSALNMLVAAGEVGNGFINEQIQGLFISHSAPDGEMTLHTEVGAYCVQLFRNHEWVPVLLDDLLPMRKKEHWTNENRGMACAHNRECRGLWVSLIEKAFAKYLGSYSQLERGYVHHALQDLTGCEAECVPLSAASRGIGKRALWDSLVRYRRNGYILGAGTGDSRLVDREVQDAGIVFNAAYTVYDVRQVGGHRLVKLRNPPGDHDEWKGDWGDKSRLWTRRLKHKLGHRDAADNTFFMSFDDFCNVFRHLYVCKYYNPQRWLVVQHPGLWKRSDEAAVEQMEMMNQFLAEQQGEGDAPVAEVDLEATNRKKARARLDSAGGLPSRHNPACVLENNPHYSLRVSRPTDLRISVTQSLSKGGRALSGPLPFSVLVVRNAHPRVPMRLQRLNKEDVVCSSGQPRSDRVVNLYADGLRPGLYMVLVAAYMSGMEGSFTVSLLSNYRCDFLPVWPPLWMLKGERMPAIIAESATANGRAAPSSSSSAKTQRVGNFFQKGLKALVGAAGGGGFEEEEDARDDDGEEDSEQGV